VTVAGKNEIGGGVWSKSARAPRGYRRSRRACRLIAVIGSVGKRRVCIKAEIPPVKVVAERKASRGGGHFAGGVELGHSSRGKGYIFRPSDTTVPRPPMGHARETSMSGAVALMVWAGEVIDWPAAVLAAVTVTVFTGCPVPVYVEFNVSPLLTSAGTPSCRQMSSCREYR